MNSKCSNDELPTDEYLAIWIISALFSSAVSVAVMLLGNDIEIFKIIILFALTLTPTVMILSLFATLIKRVGCNKCNKE